MIMPIGEIPIKCFRKLIRVNKRGIMISMNISLVLIQEFESVLIKREIKKNLLIPV